MSLVDLDNSLFPQKRDQLVNSKISKDLAMPIHGRCFGLPGKIDHLLHRLPIPGNDHCFNFDLFPGEIIHDIDAPRAAGFNIKNR